MQDSNTLLRKAEELSQEFRNCSSEIEKARRMPPGNTRAAVRGRYIREFAGSKEKIVMDWESIRIGTGKNAQVIHLPTDQLGDDGVGD